ncbi:universal stress protein [Rhizobium sp. P40RR-XXII]|uniref:universal stress protein n=1 Tax=Rhizobium sp. P40RR-XXII TaxID=2726739 RepID=UPI001FEE806C|nr:universal stress protein [Rhizobium sp. P40RR-XXII]
MEAHLVLLVVAFGAMPPYSGYAGETASIWFDERDREATLLGEKIETARAKLTASGISYEVQEFFCDFPWAPDLLGQRAMYADMTIIGSEMTADEDLRGFAIDGVLFHSPTPALIVPKDSSPVWPPRTVMIAWDAGQEAADAVHKALDILKAAERVHVAMVDPVALPGLQGEEPGADIATYLARQGVNVTVDVIASGKRSADEALQRHGVDISADLIVMGAYGHSRMRERIFGGVTRAMLEHAKLPIFLGR